MRFFAKIIFKIFIIIKELAEKLGLDKAQTVIHLHFHVLEKKRCMCTLG